MKIISVVGARPNFMKVAPIHKEFQTIINSHSSQVSHKICHTGQHYDEKMSDVFFRELELPKPDFYLGVGSGSHAEQTARVMIEFEKVLLIEKPDLVIVVGDVNSTIACSLVAVKLGIKVAHVESGLRSYDRSMPEEINRLLTDSISDYLFVTEKNGMENLQKEGVSSDKIFFVGNCMIDSIINYLPKINSSQIAINYNLNANDYIVATFHRPSNVDNPDNLKSIINLLNKLASNKKVIFPIHPRTKNNLIKYSLLSSLHSSLFLTDPIGYIDFISLVKNSTLVVTDSGGIQEETTYLGVPCITTRKTTERPVTIHLGTNYLVGEDFDKAYSTAEEIIQNGGKKGTVPELWDGKTAERIVEILMAQKKLLTITK